MNGEVQQGAALLDRVWPGWWTLIDKATLDLSSSQSCILGQLGEWATEHEAPIEVPEDPYNSFENNPYQRMTYVLYDEEEGFSESRYGFDIGYVHLAYGELDEAWEEVILQRELAASTTDTVSDL